MRKHGKKDANQNAIMDACRDIGASVADTSSLGDGFGDFVAGFRGRNTIFEVKRDAKACLTDDQTKFHAAWNGQIAVVWEPHQAVNVLLYN